MTLLIKDKDIVVPGEILAKGMDHLPAQGTSRENENIIALQLGLANINGRLIKVIALSGKYVPKFGDMVIGKIINITFSSWIVDVGYAYEANLSMKEATSDFIERGADLSQYFDYGDIITTKIVNVNKQKAIDLTMKGPGLRKLKGGRIIQVTPSKVPRIIGKQGSMISIVKEATNCQIIVGQNGRVWIQGEDPKKVRLAEEAIRKIDKESHKDGLTDEISRSLKEKKK